MIVGLTGGIGSGKSAVARLLAQRGAVIIDTDVIAREVVEPPSPILDRIREEFGPDILTAAGRLDREALAHIIFASEAKRQRLNEITHPEILKRVLAQIGRHARSSIVVVVVPLLFESGFEQNCDKVVAVVARDEVRIKRVMDRDHSTDAQVRARMGAQLSEQEYERRADIIVRNDRDAKALEEEVEAAWRRIRAAQE
jgi:dephospho-CoA kinase